MHIPENWSPGDKALSDRVILITGAGSGIGAAVAQQCAESGATIVLLDKHIRNLEQVYDRIEAVGGPQAAIYPMDLEGASEDDYTDLAATLEKEFGRLDGLLHNAALSGGLIPMAHYETSLWYKVMQVNLNAPFLLTCACLPLLQKSNDASIIFTSDSVGRKGKAYWGGYGVSKAALENLMQVLADELENNTAIRVNSLDPGSVATAMRTLVYPGEDTRNIAKPADVVNPYLYLLGPDSRGISGKQFTRSTA